MTRRTDLPTSRRHISINDEDWEFLDKLFGAGSTAAKPLGTGRAINQIVHARVLELRAKYQARMDAAAGQGASA